MMSIKVDLDGDQIKNPVFDSEEKAFDSYTRYATSHGHVVRKDGVSRDVHGKAIKRMFVCNRQGLRNNKHFM